MTLIKDELTYLLEGSHDLQKPYVPFGELQCEFLNTLSALLLNDPEAKNFPDVLTFAFWCRKSNVQRLRKLVLDGRSRLGIGSVFHIAPSNVPVNFAFSYVFGLLAGNSNYVRVPSKKFKQVDLIIRILKDCLSQRKYLPLRNYSYFFRYEHQAEITAKISANSQGRLIWGGVETIQEIRKYPIQPPGIEIAFADRFSFCCFGAKAFCAMSDNEISRIALGFYNDTYLMDQNACSSPHLVVWLGTKDESKIAQEKFWNRLSSLVHSRYAISNKAAFDKHVLFCNNAIELSELRSADIHDGLLYRLALKELPKNLEKLRGSCGYFFEYQITNLNEIAEIITPTYQTLTYAGLEKIMLHDFVLSNRLTGIDRIVPCGQALDIGVIWDGINVIQTLSRIVDVR